MRGAWLALAAWCLVRGEGGCVVCVAARCAWCAVCLVCVVCLVRLWCVAAWLRGVRDCVVRLVCVASWCGAWLRVAWSA